MLTRERLREIRQGRALRTPDEVTALRLRLPRLPRRYSRKPRRRPAPLTAWQRLWKIIAAIFR